MPGLYLSQPLRLLETCPSMHWFGYRICQNVKFGHEMYLKLISNRQTHDQTYLCTSNSVMTLHTVWHAALFYGRLHNVIPHVQMSHASGSFALTTPHLNHT